MRVKVIQVNAPPKARTRGKGCQIKDDPDRIGNTLDPHEVASWAFDQARKRKEIAFVAHGGGPKKTTRLPMWRHYVVAIALPNEPLVVAWSGWDVTDFHHTSSGMTGLLLGKYANIVRDLWDGRVKRPERIARAEAAIRHAYEDAAGVIDRLAAMGDD